MRTTIARLVALGLVLAACSGSAAETTITSTTEPPPTTTTTSTTLPPTTTTTSTTLPVFETSLVNGLPVEDSSLMERRILGVKIDNHPNANPQTGIEQAEMVIELRVEGITRYISIWHESDAELLGPMRSGRPTDAAVLAGLNGPSFAVSGAQAWVGSLIASKNVYRLGDTGPPATFRDSSRNRPHNLYVNTVELRNLADSRGYPDEPPPGPLWEFGPMPASAQPASTVTIDWGSSDVFWTWSPLGRTWVRNAYGVQSSAIDDEGIERRLDMPVLIALYVEQYTASPPPGFRGSSLPASEVIGSGTAYVFAEGKVSEGTWVRETEDVWFTLLDENGAAMTVPPGQSWLSLVPANLGLTIEP